MPRGKMETNMVRILTVTYPGFSTKVLNECVWVRTSGKMGHSLALEWATCILAYARRASEKGSCEIELEKLFVPETL